MKSQENLEEMQIKIAQARENQKKPISLGYELFILVVSVLSIFNIFLLLFPIYEQSKEVIQIINLLLSLIFISDFLFRFRNAQNKRKYFVQDAGWLDLLSSIPVAWARLLRLLRVIKVIRTTKRYGFENMVNEFGNDKAKNTLLTVMFFLLLVFEFGGALMVYAESKDPDANIKTGGDALWWAYVSVTTVGYGDRFPITLEGRMIGVFVLAAGVGLFGVLTGFLANSFLAPKKRIAKEQSSNSTDLIRDEISKIRASLDELESKL